VAKKIYLAVFAGPAPAKTGIKRLKKGVIRP
jgi:hypothetical protein